MTKRAYIGNHSFEMDPIHTEKRRQIFAWACLIVWTTTICILTVLLLLLFGKIIEIDITNRYAFGIGVEDLEKSFFSILASIVWCTPLYALALFFYNIWRDNFGKFFSSLIIKDAPKNEDH